MIIRDWFLGPWNQNGVLVDKESFYRTHKKKKEKKNEIQERIELHLTLKSQLDSQKKYKITSERHCGKFLLTQSFNISKYLYVLY